MISPELIAAHSKYLAAQRGDRHFIPECRHISVQHRNRQRSARRPFGAELESNVYLRSCHNGCSLAFTTTRMTMELSSRKKMNRSLPSSLMRTPVCRDDMALLPGMISAVEEVKQRGFEFNFPIDACHNRYRICYWRRSMGDCVNSDVDDLCRMFKEMLRVFFDSQFYKLARDAEYQG